MILDFYPGHWRGMSEEGRLLAERALCAPYIWNPDQPTLLAAVKISFALFRAYVFQSAFSQITHCSRNKLVLKILGNFRTHSLAGCILGSAWFTILEGKHDPDSRFWRENILEGEHDPRSLRPDLPWVHCVEGIDGFIIGVASQCLPPKHHEGRGVCVTETNLAFRSWPHNYSHDDDFPLQSIEENASSSHSARFWFGFWTFFNEFCSYFDRIFPLPS